MAAQVGIGVAELFYDIYDFVRESWYELGPKFSNNRQKVVFQDTAIPLGTCQSSAYSDD